MFESFLVNDHLVAVNEMLFELMRKDTLKRCYFICIGNFLNDFSSFIIHMSRLNEAKSCLSCLISGKDNISLFAGNGGVLIGLNNNSVSDKGGKSINMSS